MVFLFVGSLLARNSPSVNLLVALRYFTIQTTIKLEHTQLGNYIVSALKPAITGPSREKSSIKDGNGTTITRMQAMIDSPAFLSLCCERAKMAMPRGGKIGSLATD